jgi:hypothetical protein
VDKTPPDLNRGDDALKYHIFEEIHEQPEVLATFLEEEWGEW